jgi:hypothetical protein
VTAEALARATTLAERPPPRAGQLAASASSKASSQALITIAQS